MEVFLFGDEGQIVILKQIPGSDRVQFGSMVADQKESLVFWNLLHAFGVKSYAAHENQMPGRADQEPSVIAAVLLVDLLGINEKRTYKKKYPIL